MVTKIANVPLLKARRARSVCHWSEHLPTVFVPFVEDIIPHTEALKFTQLALNDRRQNRSLLNTETSLMRKTVLHSKMNLDMITFCSLGGTYAIIQTEYPVFTHTLHEDTSKWDPTPSLRDLINQSSDHGALRGKNVYLL